MAGIEGMLIRGEEAFTPRDRQYSDVPVLTSGRSDGVTRGRSCHARVRVFTIQSFIGT